MALALLALCFANNVLRLIQGSLSSMCLLSIFWLQLLTLVFHSLRFKNWSLGIFAQLGIQRPVFLGHKGFDFTIPIGHDFYGYGLHTACTQALAHLAP